jgi:hypothetical protein
VIEEVEIPEGKHVEEELVAKAALLQLLPIVVSKGLARHRHLYVLRV